MRKLRLIFTFYNSYSPASILITLACMYFIYTLGIKAFVALFWFKVVTLAIIVYFVNDLKKKEYYYYNNLGLTKLFLWISTLLLDISIFIFFLIISFQIR